MITIDQWRAAIACCRTGRLKEIDIAKYKECCARYHEEDEDILQWGCPLCDPENFQTTISGIGERNLPFTTHNDKAINIKRMKKIPYTFKKSKKSFQSYTFITFVNIHFKNYHLSEEHPADQNHVERGQDSGTDINDLEIIPDQSKETKSKVNP